MAYLHLSLPKTASAGSEGDEGGEIKGSGVDLLDVLRVGRVSILRDDAEPDAELGLIDEDELAVGGVVR